MTAPWAQQNYKKFKCKVDQWNRAFALYSRGAWHTTAQVMYTQFFVHAYVLQSYTYWKACTGQNISQVKYRELLVRGIMEALESG